MAKKKTPKLDSTPIELDPILPLPAGTGIPEVKQGQGKEILENTSVRIVELPYRAFYMLWEVAEKRAAENYARYVGGPMDHAAQAYLEAVLAFRNAARSAAGLDHLPFFTEEQARKIRKKFEKHQRALAEQEKAARSRKGKTTPESPDPQDPVESAHEHEIVRKRSKKTGDRYWICSSCGERFSSDPGEAPERPSKALEPSRGSRKAGKSAKAPQKGKKKAKKTA